MWVSAKDKYIGMKKENNQGYEMEVIDYLDYDHATIHFLPPYEGNIIAKICHFLDGGIHNPYAPTVCNYGIVGSKYSTRDKINTKKHGLEYLTWINMLKRCVDEKNREKNPTYKDVTIDPRWQFYENFYEWMHEQENFDNLRKLNDVNLDKDILIKGNKIYSPETCTLVPAKINNLLLGSNAIRGKYPIGVYYLKRNRKFAAHEGGRKNCKYLGLFNTPEDAFKAYKRYKEQKIKNMAEKEFDKGNITQRCYEALVNYRVEITD